jgi:hypothetical protein
MAGAILVIDYGETIRASYNSVDKLAYVRTGGEWAQPRIYASLSMIRHFLMGGA